jgi:hypothetical protein
MADGRKAQMEEQKIRVEIKRFMVESNSWAVLSVREVFILENVCAKCAAHCPLTQASPSKNASL